MPLPKLIAENHDRLRVLAVRSVGGDQGAAQQGGDAEMGAGVSCELDRRDILREVFVGRREIPRPPACGRAFDTLCLTEKLELRTGDSDPPVVTGFVDDDQMDHAVGAVVWERIYQQAID